MGIRDKYYTYPIDTPLIYRKLCLPFLKISGHVTQIHVQGIHRANKFVECRWKLQ